MPCDFVVLNGKTVPVPAEIRQNGPAIAAWIDKQTKAAPQPSAAPKAAEED